MAKRVTLVCGEMLGAGPQGGLGTAMTFLALAMGRLRHSVEVLYTSPLAEAGVADAWMKLYEQFDVRIRTLEGAPDNVDPRWLRRAYQVLLALRDDPPDVVVAQDWGGPAYAALRMRDAGLEFSNTTFVVACHGTTRWIAEAHGKTQNSVDTVGLGLLERASVELADIVVSPSAYMLGWMRDQGWQLPKKSLVIPNLTRSAALDEPPPTPVEDSGPPRRLAFFGRVEERKGVGTLLDALDELDPALLDGIELAFLGAVSTRWSTKRVSERLAQGAGARLARVRFETRLDQPEALAELRQPGTLAVMPSHLEHSPCTVSECLEYGIPFLASDRGGTPELIAEADRPRVLVEPRAASLGAALARLLRGEELLARARPHTDGCANVVRWADVIADPGYPTTVVEQGEPGDWELVLSEDAVPEDGVKEILLQAQAASGADIVTCGAREDATVHLFIGEPGPLGLIANHYGSVALVSRRLLSSISTAWTTDSVWPLLARASLEGARIISVPEPLVRVSRPPETVVERLPSAAAVLDVFAHAQPERLRDLPRLTVALAGDIVTAERSSRRIMRRRRRLLET